LTDTEKKDDYPAISLSEVDEATLRSWVDAGYMTPAEYEREMQARKHQGKAESPPQK